MKTGTLYSQFSVTMDYRQVKANEATLVPIIVHDPVGNTYSTAELSRKFPSAKIPVENITVNFPDLSGAVDTASILWYLKPENYSAKGEINIVLVAITADSVKTFYVDNNNDRTFSDTEEKFSFSREMEKKEVQIKILGNVYKYTLMNPDYTPPIIIISRTKYYAKSWVKASKKPSISFDFSIITGGGDARLSFVPAVGYI